MPSVFGNLNGASWRDSAEIVRSALLKYESKERSISRGNALANIFKQLIGMAADGDKQAAELIFNRLWGKPKQQVDITGEGATELVALFQAAAELRQRIADSQVLTIEHTQQQTVDASLAVPVEQSKP